MSKKKPQQSKVATRREIACPFCGHIQSSKIPDGQSVNCSECHRWYA